MSPLDLEAIGLTLDDIDLDIDYSDNLPALPLDRPRHRKREHWQTTDAESHLLNLPDFDSHADRARYMVGEMGRAALANIDGATVDDPIFSHDGEMVSLNELLAIMDARELSVLLGPDAHDL